MFCRHIIFFELFCPIRESYKQVGRNAFVAGDVEKDGFVSCRLGKVKGQQVKDSDVNSIEQSTQSRGDAMTVCRVTRRAITDPYLNRYTQIFNLYF